MTTSILFLYDDNVSTVGPHLCSGLAIVSEAQDIVACWDACWDFHDVPDRVATPVNAFAGVAWCRELRGILVPGGGREASVSDGWMDSSMPSPARTSAIQFRRAYNTALRGCRTLLPRCVTNQHAHTYLPGNTVSTWSHREQSDPGVSGHAAQYPRVALARQPSPLMQVCGTLALP